MVDLHKIATKWQKEWDKQKSFEADPDNRPKFFVTFPYPYVNGYAHAGHMYTVTRVEAMARYQRMKGKNVLFPQASWGVLCAEKQTRLRDRCGSLQGDSYDA